MSGRGQIQLILGPMFSGKTTELIRRIKRYETANHKCMVVKYSKDVRYDEGENFSNSIATHDRLIVFSWNIKLKTPKILI